jgi:hypothetical protein
MSTLLAEVAPTKAVVDRPAEPPRAFADAGLHILRTPLGEGPEIWCRCDGGPHGFLSIAAHGHADALSVEVRHDGVELLVDPGTYCYHGQPEWRSYFRSTRAHNTIEIDGENQVHEAGPFMWAGHADAVVDGCDVDPAGQQKWTAHHTSYSRLDAALRHAREVVLDGVGARITVTDTLTGSRAHWLRMFWHLGPEVTVELMGAVADLSWAGREGELRQAQLVLPVALEWAARRGETEPQLGWHSPRFGERVPTTTLVGMGEWSGTLDLRTDLRLPSFTRAASAVPTDRSVAAGHDR